MKIISWNVNGLRAVMRKNFFEFLEDKKPDVLCLQEIKIGKTDERDKISFEGYDVFWNSAERPGYSGTAMLIKKGIRVKDKKNGFGFDKFDSEGRTQILDLDDFYLFNAYFPNAGAELARLDYKIEYDRELLKFLKKQKKPIILTGDYNVAHREIDLARPDDNHGNAGFTKEEREWMGDFLNSGYKDVFREFYPRKEKYTYWSYRTNARARNVGWRIDYFCVSDDFFDKVKKIEILDDVKGSDHCPILLKI